MTDEIEVVVVKMVANEPEAEVDCALLREEGIKCGHRITDNAGGALGLTGGGGMREICVAPGDAERARELLGEPAQA
jgi:hypothetical protein